MRPDSGGASALVAALPLHDAGMKKALDCRWVRQQNAVGSLYCDLRNRKFLVISVADDKLEDLSESHPRNGLPNFFNKIKNGEAVTIAFLGGSITLQPGWRSVTVDYFRKKYPNTIFTEINGAITGTNSCLGASRIERDILDHNPDLVFVEFAVNDGNGEFSKKTYEGMVRKTLSNNITTDICLVYAANIHQIDHLLEGEYQPSAQNMEVVAEHYRIPTIHMAVGVAQLLKEGRLSFTAPLPPDGSGKIDGRIVFSPDGAHPYPETGHRLYWEAIERSLPAIENASKHVRTKIPAPLDDNNWQDVKLIPPDEAMLSPDWRKLSPQSNSIAKQFSRFAPAIWMAEKPLASIEFTFYGSTVGLYGVKGPDVGRLLIQLDDQRPFAATFFYVSSHPYDHYLQSIMLAAELPLGRHNVRIEIDREPIDKVEMFARKNTRVRNTAVFRKQRTYISDIIIKGDMLPE